MQLEEVFIKNPEKKILDSCVFSSPWEGLARHNYICKTLDELNIAKIIRHVEYTANFQRRKLEAARIYVIPECILEKEALLEHLNKNLNFLRKENYAKAYQDHEALMSLSVLCKRTYNLIRNLGHRSVIPTFSQIEKQSYQELVGELICGVLENDIKKSQLSNIVYPIKKKYKKDYNTDEKIVATAMTLAEKEQVAVLTRDHHIKVIAEYAFTHLLVPRRKMDIFADFGRGFNLAVRSSDFIKAV